jgi:hypothetical protein
MHAQNQFNDRAGLGLPLDILGLETGQVQFQAQILSKPETRPKYGFGGSGPTPLEHGPEIGPIGSGTWINRVSLGT